MEVRFEKMIMAVCVAAMFSLVSDARQAQESEPHTAKDCCDVVRRAYADARAIEPGMTRLQIEHKWDVDGGIQELGETEEETRYVYRKCDSLKLKIEFRLAKKGAEGPEDTVIKVATPVYAEPAYMD